jgi:hypothetical protein
MTHGMKSAGVTGVDRSSLLLALALGLGLAGCGAGARGDDGPGAAGAAPDIERTVELGIPGGPDGLDFVPLEDGTELRLQTFGQGGTHLIIGVRCDGYGNRAFVSATLRNLTSDVEVEEPAPARPQLLYCAEGETACDLVPYLVHASGLTDTDEEKDGLRVELTARASDETGESAEAKREIVLSTADL